MEKQLAACLAAPKGSRAGRCALVRGRFPDSPLVQAWCLFATNDNTSQAERDAACQRWIELEPDNAAPTLVKLEMLAEARGRLLKSPPSFSREDLEELAAALRKPVCDFHLAEAEQAVHRLVRELGFPMSSLSLPESYFGNFLMQLVGGLMRRQAQFKAMSRPDLEQLHAVALTLKDKIRPAQFHSGTTKVGASFLESAELGSRRALLGDAATAEETKAIDDAYARKKKDERAWADEPRTWLEVLPLPSLHEAMVRERSR
jgi:hypothetical protein